MRCFHYIFFLTFIPCDSFHIQTPQIYKLYDKNIQMTNHIIENENRKICANCKFFISNKKECRKSGEMNIVTGEYIYNTAISTRNDETVCGKNATLYEKNNFVFITNTYYFLVDHLLFVYFILFYIILVEFSIYIADIK